MSAEQTRIVVELLKKPRYSVAAKVKAKWTELTSPKTSTAGWRELLGRAGRGRVGGRGAGSGR